MTTRRWLRQPTEMLRVATIFILSVILAGLLTMAFIAVISGVAALHTRDDTAARSSARVTLLQARITQLTDELQMSSERNARLEAQLAVLKEQVRRLGGSPITGPATTTTTTPRVAPQAASRGVQRTTLNWAALRRCESGGNYGNKRNPTYRGGYQFSRGTWASVGGSGDPADAPAVEQDMRAELLFQRGGRGQWPVCGRLL